MGIISRVRDLMSSNIHALLDKEKDPVQAADRLMRSLESDLGQVKAEAASAQIQQNRAKKALDENTAEISKLQRYAEKATADGEDGQALRFLERKAMLVEKQHELKAAYDQASAAAEILVRMQDKLTADMSRLQTRHAQLKAALAETRMRESGIRGGAGGDVQAAFDAAEDKISRAMYEAEALAELRGGGPEEEDLDVLIARLEGNSDTAANTAAASPADELAELKAKNGR